MAITAQTILDRAATLLNDEDSVRWTDEEKLGWLNEGRRDIAALRPDAYATTAIVQMASGTRQTLPSDGFAFLGAVRNMAGGVTPARAIRTVDRGLLDVYTPDWHSETPTSEVRTCSPDVSVPTYYYVYPPADGSGFIELTYARLPADVAAADSLKLSDKYAPALTNYVAYRAYAKDSEEGANANLAAAYLKLFTDAVAAVK